MVSFAEELNLKTKDRVLGKFSRMSLLPISLSRQSWEIYEHSDAHTNTHTDACTHTDTGKDSHTDADTQTQAYTHVGLNSTEF